MAKIITYQETRKAIDAEWIIDLISKEIKNFKSRFDSLYDNFSDKDFTEGCPLEQEASDIRQMICVLQDMRLTIESEIEKES